MTLEERQMAANAELKEIGKWLIEESKRVSNKLDEEQGIERKFDSGNEPYKEMHKEFARRCLAVQKKYNLPSDTKLKLW